jgi:hypothetical protein
MKMVQGIWEMNELRARSEREGDNDTTQAGCREEGGDVRVKQ